VERRYVAIDLHLNRSVIVCENEAGEKVGVTCVENDPFALADALGEAGEHPEVAIEATYGWYWAVDVLEEMGANVPLVNPSGLNWEDRRVKNDYRDQSASSRDSRCSSPLSMNPPTSSCGRSARKATATTSTTPRRPTWRRPNGQP
jgi:hypothetical protein